MTIDGHNQYPLSIVMGNIYRQTCCHSVMVHNVFIRTWSGLLLPRHCSILFERSEFRIATSKKKKNCPSARVHACSTNLGFRVEKIVLVSVGYQRAPGTSGQGDSASLVKPTQDQRRLHKAVVSLVGPASKVKADCCCCAVLPQCTCLLLMLL